jgi:hypothetical protein
LRPTPRDKHGDGVTNPVPPGGPETAGGGNGSAAGESWWRATPLPPPRGYNPGVNHRLSKHANAEMLRRQISPEWIEATLASPEQVVEGYGNRKIYQSRFTTLGKTYLIRVVLEPWRDPPTVVTLYRTSKIDKYWSES